MPVGTKATVKGILPPQLEQLGAKIVLANTYHLSNRPGEDVVAEMGGLHDFMQWHHPILTDSGGFQVFSHGEFTKLTDDGVEFRTVDYDGSHVFWTPERNMDIAQKLGADIVMQLDQCPGYPASRSFVERAVELSGMWAERCYKAHTREDQALFGIVQGGMHMDLRLRSLRHLEDCGDFPGYGIGGYSVGEDHETMFETLAPLASEYMPRDKPRYLMGVGNPTTLVHGVSAGSTCSTACFPPGRRAWAPRSRVRDALTSRTRASPTTRVPSTRTAPAPCARGLQPRLHPPPGQAEGDGRLHPAVAPQRVLPARPHASRAPGHHRAPLRRVRACLGRAPRRQRLVAARRGAGARRDAFVQVFYHWTSQTPGACAPRQKAKVYGSRQEVLRVPVRR